MENKRVVLTTTFQLPIGLHKRMKLMCHLTGVTMGEFIRVSIRDKMDNLKVEEK